jgi:carbon-monoxide dehydrogenase medium subunit
MDAPARGDTALAETPRDIKDGGSAMKPAPFEYHAPGDLAEALELMQRLDDVRPLAGGQSLMPMMNFRFVQPKSVVDLNRIESLQTIERRSDRISFGAVTRQRAIMHSPLVDTLMPVVPTALRFVGHRQTRARGTIGGSLSHFDPSAELANLACLLDAEFVLERKGAERKLDWQAFAKGFMTTAIAPNELLTRIELAAWPVRHAFAFHEFALRHGDFAIAAASSLIALASNGRIARAAVVVSGVSAVPQRLHKLEAEMIGQSPDTRFAAMAVDAAGELEAMDDAYVPASYRTRVGREMVSRAITQALANVRSEAAA